MDRKQNIYYADARTNVVFWNNLEWGQAKNLAPGYTAILPLEICNVENFSEIRPTAIDQNDFYIVSGAILEINKMIDEIQKEEFHGITDGLQCDIFDKFIAPLSKQQYDSIIKHFEGMKE